VYSPQNDCSGLKELLSSLFPGYRWKKALGFVRLKNSSFIWNR
jgi:hypothetical protein